MWEWWTTCLEQSILGRDTLLEEGTPGEDTLLEADTPGEDNLLEEDKRLAEGGKRLEEGTLGEDRQSEGGTLAVADTVDHTAVARKVEGMACPRKVTVPTVQVANRSVNSRMCKSLQRHL